MLLKTCRTLLLSLFVGAACTEDPQVSTSAMGEPDRPLTTFGPSMTTPGGSAGEPTTGTLETTGLESTATGEPGSSSSTTDPAEPVCGDGVVTEPEECDDGELNANTAACTLACKHAVCGDGYLWADGGEECDFAHGNNEAYGGCHPVTCKRGPHCGDGILDAKHELCDRGELNGSGISDDELAPCGTNCDFFGRIFFITSETFSGDLNGVSGGDLKCQAAAAAADLPHPNRYRAWLSNSFQSPASRIEAWDSDVPLILVGGLVLAADITELVLDGPRIGVSRTEFGDTLFEQMVWTNTSSYGEIFSGIDHCTGWTAASKQLSAQIGFNAFAVEDSPMWQTWKAERWWTSYKAQMCSKTARLYCIDDGEILGGQD